MIMTCKTKGVSMGSWSIWRWLMAPLGTKWTSSQHGWCLTSTIRKKSYNSLLSFQIQNPMTWTCPYKEEHCNTLKSTYVMIFPSSSPMGSMVIYLDDWVHRGEGNSNLSRLLDSESQVTLSPGDSEHHHGPHVRCQVINAMWWPKSDFQDPWTHQVAISSVPYLIFGIDTLGSLSNPHVGFLAFGTSAIIVEKTKWKPLKLLLFRGPR